VSVRGRYLAGPYPKSNGPVSRPQTPFLKFSFDGVWWQAFHFSFLTEMLCIFPAPSARTGHPASLMFVSMT
jgi:hypothetical protein